MERMSEKESSSSAQNAPPDRSASAFVPIGVTFLAVGLAMLASEATRPTAWAFLPLGFTFFILGMTANARHSEDAPGEAPEDGEASSDADDDGQPGGDADGETGDAGGSERE